MTKLKETAPSSGPDLTSCSTPQVFACGTGLSLHKDILLPAILNAKHEIVLATCFWAPSATLNELISTLKQLSSQVIARDNITKIKVYICFSSRSATQKLFHTSSLDGYIYPTDEWPKKLGLPPSQELPGLKITVKSLFLRPFSVLHSKYLIVDRQTVFLPSCNVSWEDWYECVVGLKGPIVQYVFEFWKDVWRPGELESFFYQESMDDSASQEDIVGADYLPLLRQSLETTLLPHPYNSSIRQALWFLSNSVAPLPRSPLNLKLLNLISQAKKEVVMLTPNFTSMPAFTAVSSALLNGAHIHLITNRRMMVPEQLVTAGALTEQYIDRLIKEYRREFRGHKMQRRIDRLRMLVGTSPTMKPARLGELRISYFSPPEKSSSTAPSSFDTGSGIAALADKSHIKLTLVDRNVIILGSGNMDRASWRTSQELGVLIEDQRESIDLASDVQRMWSDVEKGLQGCLEHYFGDSP